MEKELTSAEKARKVKLSNKTIEELVEVIFRKDNTEKKLQRLNKCLKTNIIGLENKCKIISDDLNESEEEVIRLNKIINNLKEDEKVQSIRINNLKKEIKIINSSWMIILIIICLLSLILICKLL